MTTPDDSLASGNLSTSSGRSNPSMTFRKLPAERILDPMDHTQVLDTADEPPLLSAALSIEGLSIVSVVAGTDKMESISKAGIRQGYVLLAMLGKGGQGEVWEAHQINLARTVAVKKVLGPSASHDNFLREAYTAAQLDHPNIVPIYELGAMPVDGEAVPILSMKRVTGRSWQEVIGADRKAQPFSLNEFLGKHIPILVHLCNAVAYAHSKKIIHRDLKPAQVMIGEFGEVFLLDWGLAVYTGDAADKTLVHSDEDRKLLFTLETASNPAGTPAFMAPEQTRQENHVLGLHTDIYLLGGILYQLLAGAPPHIAPTAWNALYKAQRNEFDPLPDNVPKELAALCLQCLETDPAKRPATALAIRQELDAYVTGASRKRESAALTERIAAEQDARPYKSYGNLSDHARLLAQAGSLWPENPAIDPCKNMVLEKFVEVALENRDFVLAQVQARRVSNPEQAAALRKTIEKAREHEARRLAPGALITPLRAVAMTGTLVLILGAVLGIVIAARNVLITEVEAKAASMAMVAAKQVDPRDLRAVAERQEINAPEFQNILNKLNFIRRSNEDIRFIRTLWPDAGLGRGNWIVLVDADPFDSDLNGDGVVSEDEKGNPPGTVFSRPGPALDDAFSLRVAQSVVSGDYRGGLISGYAPVLDHRTGNPIGLVGVDVRMDEMRYKLQRVLWAGATGAIFLTVLVTATFIAYFSSRRALDRIRRLEAAMSKQNAELEQQDLYLG